ncbi:MAG: phytase [Novosphingobium sp.]
MRRALTLLLAAGSLAGCATVPPPDSLPAVGVAAKGETQPVGTNNADAADDPAIWRNPADPAASLIVATDKKAGLYVYGLDGQVRGFDPAGRLNNVDLIAAPDGSVLVVASDRNDPVDARLRLYRLDTAAAKLVPLGTVGAGTGEAYGVCLWRAGPDNAEGPIEAFSVLKDGSVHQVRLDLSGSVPSGAIIRSLKLATQTEGCVVDPRSASLYVGEEDVGIWRFSARADGATTGELVAQADGRQLVMDTEGLAIAPEGADGGWLVASSQGDNAYAVYRLPDLAPVGRFRIAAGKFGATEETDGIDLALGDFGPDYPGGLFVAQDGNNGAAAQNFKLVSWQDVLAALAKR